MKHLGPLQLRIMCVLWAKSSKYAIDVHEILEALNAGKDQPELAYTTVATVLRSLVKFGFANSYERKRRHVFDAAVSDNDYATEYLQHLKEWMFKGDEEALVAFIGRWL